MRILVASLLAAIGTVLIASGITDANPDGKKKRGKFETIDFTAMLEPADLGPGGSGVLVVQGTIDKDFHVYATSRGEVQPLTWKPIVAAGVEYDVKNAKLSEHHEYKDPFLDEPNDVWDGTLTLRVPVTLSLKFKPGTKIGVLISYSACSSEMCNPHQEDIEASLIHGAAAKIANGGESAAPPGVAVNPEGAASGVKIKGASIEVRLEPNQRIVVVSVTPEPGHKVTVGEGTGEPITVRPQAAEGVVWGAVEYPLVGGDTEDPVEIRIPFTNTGPTRVVDVKVELGVCDVANDRCYTPEEPMLGISLPGEGGGTAPAPDKPDPGTAKADAPKGKVIFPVIDDDDFSVKNENLIQAFHADYGLLVLGLIFLLGAGLAFTPCVLPIIPITVAVVTGGRSDLPRRRLLALLSTYVLSMATTFGIFGVVAASAGASMSAAFQIPAVIWGIAGLFFVLAYAMLGIIELQPPQWMTKLQGGAQQKGGSLVGAALLGCVMAFVASPCTGPFIVAMTVVLAQTESIPLGFGMFFSMGLGMGAVLFAFGALNFALRPGPWMVWVRYGFGMLLFGGALYYVADPQQLVGLSFWIVAIAGAVLAGYLVARHLIRAEGEQPPVAWGQGGKVTAMFMAAAAIIFMLTYIPPLPDDVDPELVKWQKLEDVDHLKKLVAQNVAAGRPTVVDVWATWCKYCKVYEQFIKKDERLRFEGGKVGRLKIDVSKKNPEWGRLRDALGIPRGTQPFFVFLDNQGRIRRKADIDRWYEDEKKSKKALMERLELVLDDDFGPGNEGKPFRVK